MARRPVKPARKRRTDNQDRVRVVTVKLTVAEHEAIRAAVDRENAEILADGNDDGTTATVSSWLRDHALDPLGLA